MSEPRLSFGTKLGYSVGGIGQGVSYNLFYVYFVFFLTDYAGIKPAVAGTITLVSIMWDAITDPLVGHTSDNSKNPKGRRRPFMAKAILPFGIAAALLFMNMTGLSMGARIAYYIGANILYWLFYTITDIPYMTLGGEIAHNDAERMSVRSFGNIMYYVGFLIATSCTLPLMMFFSKVNGGDDMKGWMYTGIIYGVIIFATYGISVLATKGKEKPAEEAIGAAAEEQEKVHFMKSLATVFKVKPYVGMVLYMFLMNIGVVIITSGLPYLLVHYAAMTEAQQGTLYTFYVIVVSLLSVLIGRMSGKFDPRKALIFTLVAFAAGEMMFKFVPLGFWQIYIMFVFVAIGIVGWGVISYAMVYDIAAFGPLKTGIQNQAMFVSVFQFMYKFSGAVGTWILGWLLTFYQYDATAEVLPERAIQGIRTIMTMWAGLFEILAIPAVIFLYKLTPTAVRKLKELADKKRSGEQIDDSEWEPYL